VPSSESGGTGADSTSLQQVIAESDHIAGPRIDEFTRLAAAVQTQRFTSGASDQRPITRSTALWTLMHLDEDIRSALEKSGVDKTALGDVLSIRRVPRPSNEGSPQLHEDFTRAIRAYLSELTEQRPIELADVASAIVRAGRDDSSGLLPERLERLGADRDAAMSAVARLVVTHGEPTDLNLTEFSASVRDVRQRLGGSAMVTASQIAESLQNAHPGYGGGTFQAVRLRPSVGSTAPVNDWLGRVRGLYDMAAIARTRHRVIDGELTLLGLAELDAVLADDLGVDGFLDALTASAEQVPRRDASDRTEWAPDAPAEEDLLGRQRLAEALAVRIKRLAEPGSPSTKSFLVHVDGPWGAGKSTLFEFLKEQLNSTFLVVSINAWQEQRVGLPWWTILSALRRAVASSTPWYRRPWAWFGGLLDRIGAGLVPFVAALLALGAVLIGLISVADFDLTASGQAAESITRVVSLAALAVAGVLAAARYLLPWSRKSAQGIVETNDNPMHEVGRLFARTLRRAKRPVVFLIDDLDRCDGDYVVEFLEVVQTLVRDAPRFLPESAGRQKAARWSGAQSEVAGPYAFVAADGRWIRSSYEKHYETFRHTSAPGRPLGYLFLEKVFQLQVRLPSITPSAKEAFLASLLAPALRQRTPRDAQADVVRTAQAKDAVHEATSESEVIEAARKAVHIQDPVARMEVLGDAAVRFSERAIGDATEHALARFSVYLEPNPRSMKLFVNTYGVLRSLRTLEEVFVPSGPLGLWTVIEIRWPYLADYLRAHPDTVASRETEPNLPADVESLLRSDEVTGVLGDTRSGPLTPDLIRQCCGSV